MTEQERQTWLDSLQNHYANYLVEIKETEKHLRELRAARDVAGYIIAVLTPLERRGAVDTDGGNG